MRRPHLKVYFATWFWPDWGPTQIAMRYAFILVSLCGSVEASERASIANYFTVCRNACGDFDPQNFVGDGSCDDGGPGSLQNMCPLGNDCADCGPRNLPPGAPPPPAPPPEPPNAPPPPAAPHQLGSASVTVNTVAALQSAVANAAVGEIILAVSGSPYMLDRCAPRSCAARPCFRYPTVLPPPLANKINKTCAPLCAQHDRNLSEPRHPR